MEILLLIAGALAIVNISSILEFYLGPWIYRMARARKPALGNKIKIQGSIDPLTAFRFIGEFKWLNNDVAAREIRIFLNSNGGSAIAGKAICQQMKKCKKPIEIECFTACSAAAPILASGTKGRRFVWEYSEVKIHDGYLFGSSRISRIVGNIFLPILMWFGNRFDKRLLLEGTGQPWHRIREDMKREAEFRGQEIVEYGFADRVLA
ncbi:ATP-dependent Clp protease proteolytic subunit [Patescibacteria group bacterium AH-259-L07]|nr:ATP-dependent Clp protease proteolytic subunit [Patescibacteria group bacterium AH-259-L07]